jgi:RHS repeat-associated protein
MTDSSGSIAWSADYEPFGEVNITTNFQPNQMRFPGQIFDEETSLHYNYHRFYDPRRGKYLTPDPSHHIQPRGVTIDFLIPYVLNTPKDLHSFSYAIGNPIKFSDPYGLNVGIHPFDDPIPGPAYMECLDRVQARYLPHLVKIYEDYIGCLKLCDKIRELNCEVGSTMKTVTIGGCKLACLSEYILRYHKVGFKIGIRSLACWALYQQGEKQVTYHNTEP